MDTIQGSQCFTVPAALLPRCRIGRTTLSVGSHPHGTIPCSVPGIEHLDRVDHNSANPFPVAWHHLGEANIAQLGIPRHNAELSAIEELLLVGQ
ncbi:hypothetical protein J2S64_002577 [Paeniglutamicibacter sulfureus]|uniref:Uncharacterized protein n=1 Tax=Paeniglutamicibacter sulfureus TaxID=43666 RepID=A0ABU2BKW5_9MICC|nr:hypothetical protein [Paeniglutamicibacter sulfureus]